MNASHNNVKLGRTRRCLERRYVLVRIPRECFLLVVLALPASSKGWSHWLATTIGQA